MNLPDPVEKRDLIYGDDVRPEELEDLGNRFFEAGYLVDAVEAYIEGDVREGGKKTLNEGVEQGNYFLVQKVNEHWGDLVDKEVWGEAGENAEEAGRLTDAVKLYYAGGFQADVRRTEEKLEEEFGHSIPAVVRADTADAKEKDEVEND